MLQDFKKFILRGNVVDLAVAVVVGAAFNAVISAFVKDLIQPLINGITGSSKGDAIQGVAHFHALRHNFTFPWGDFVSSVISFLLIAAVVFFFVVHPLNKVLARLSPKESVDRPAERQCPFCMSAIPSPASRCKFCTSKVEPKTK